MMLYKYQKPRFIRIILEDTSQNKELLPLKIFVRRSNKAILQVPSGIEWQMKLSNSAGRVSHRASWQQFADLHSLKAGYKLAFTYEGDSKFSVLVYDTSSCEIIYPMPTTISDESEDSDESSIRIIGEDTSRDAGEQTKWSFSRATSGLIRGG